ncbi:MAG TPA: pentapeptide repeat-containing protein, partial [Spirochaetota bacterium]|nr:pentapeptide repeat-containing protein [Spirochaetota bacterium]
MKKVKAYKVFDENMQCRGFQYKLGESYTIEGNLEVCSNGFHACEKLLDCFNYYSFSPRNKIALVILSGEIQKKEDKLCAETIQIKKMISWEEALKMCNSGDCNSGYRNSGDYNSGDYNSGNRNSGYYNSGDYNSGDYNSGNRNSG